MNIQKVGPSHVKSIIRGFEADLRKKKLTWASNGNFKFHTNEKGVFSVLGFRKSSARHCTALIHYVALTLGQMTER